MKTERKEQGRWREWNKGGERGWEEGNGGEWEWSGGDGDED